MNTLKYSLNFFFVFFFCSMVLQVRHLVDDSHTRNLGHVHLYEDQEERKNKTRIVTAI